MRETEGVLKKDEERKIVFEDGAIKSFGKDPSCDFYIPLEDLDLKQFSIYNRDGVLYLIDESNEFPTRIKVQPGLNYRLNVGDFVSIGLDQDVYVSEATSEKLPSQGDDKNINIRYVPEGVSKAASAYLNS